MHGFDIIILLFTIFKGILCSFLRVICVNEVASLLCTCITGYPLKVSLQQTSKAIEITIYLTRITFTRRLKTYFPALQRWLEDNKVKGQGRAEVKWPHKTARLEIFCKRNRRAQSLIWVSQICRMKGSKIEPLTHPNLFNLRSFRTLPSIITVFPYLMNALFSRCRSNPGLSNTVTFVPLSPWIVWAVTTESFVDTLLPYFPSH